MWPVVDFVVMGFVAACGCDGDGFCWLWLWCVLWPVVGVVVMVFFFFFFRWWWLVVGCRFMVMVGKATVEAVEVVVAIGLDFFNGCLSLF